MSISVVVISILIILWSESLSVSLTIFLMGIGSPCCWEAKLGEPLPLSYSFLETLIYKKFNGVFAQILERSQKTKERVCPIRGL